MKDDKALEQDLIKTFIELQKRYQEEHHNGIVTRDYFRKHSKFREEQWASIFGSFKGFREEVDRIANFDFDSLEFEQSLINLKEENKLLRSEKKELLKKAINEDTILNLFKDSLNNYSGEIEEPIYDQIDNRIVTEEHNNKALLHLSDWHLGEVVIKEEVGNVNEFNSEILIKRADKVINDFVRYSNYFKIKTAHIIFNGDLLSGDIHRELERNSEMNSVKCILYLKCYINKKLTELTKYFNKIIVDITVGNHTRIIPGRPYHKEKVEMNWEYVLGHMIKQYFDVKQEDSEIKKVEINVSKSSFMVREINNNRFLITHGDVLTGKGTGGFAGIPFYGLASSAAKFYGIFHQIGIDKNTTHFDNILIGHLHTSSMQPIFNGGCIFINGSLIGTNEFSINVIKSVAKIEQTMLVIDETGYIHNIIILHGT